MEHVLKLNQKQIIQLLHYVIAEVKGKENDGNQSSKILDRRCNLLLTCCLYDPQLTKAAMDHLAEAVQQKRSETNEIVLFLDSAH